MASIMGALRCALLSSNQQTTACAMSSLGCSLPFYDLQASCAAQAGASCKATSCRRRRRRRKACRATAARRPAAEAAAAAAHRAAAHRGWSCSRHHPAAHAAGCRFRFRSSALAGHAARVAASPPICRSTAPMQCAALHGTAGRAACSNHTAAGLLQVWRQCSRRCQRCWRHPEASRQHCWRRSAGAWLMSSVRLSIRSKVMLTTMLHVTL